eukprot:CAMPEP_0182430272 /NCGR_PEP_ID=MMETSP1167-20130531/38994_1 /TAXON_ID=2988 /ORGANISM="Mallomonas Sp, Strain CCMP3275" /LENGTH=488 /DNA_ID=CAMNT_0024615183 /DNA_START=99 /DNA_END=1565 /DNA_ORIENTATION=+
MSFCLFRESRSFCSPLSKSLIRQNVYVLKAKGSSGLGKKRAPRQRVDDIDGQRRSDADPWKVLITKLDKTKDSSAKFGKIQKPVIVSNQIDELQCPHFNECSGCTITGNFTESPIIQQAKSFFTSQGIPLSLSLHKTHHWRTHVKLAVQPLSRWGGLVFGLYERGSHQVVPIPNCQVHHPKINTAVEVLRRVASECGVRGYESERNGLPSQGDLRYIQMSVEREKERVQLVLVWNADSYKSCSLALSRLVKRLKSMSQLWHSITINFHTENTNVIFNYHPRSWKILWGPPALKEKIGRATFFFRPQVFRQANLDAFEKLVLPAVERAVLEKERVSELYAGLGVIGLNVVHKSTEVLCSDRDSTRGGDEMFDKGADTLPESDRERVYYEPLSAAEAVEQGQLEGAGVLIVDPPRKGLDKEVMNVLMDKHKSVSAPDLKRLVYVSCGFEALEREIIELIRSGKWRLVSAEGFLLFPGSDHIETVAVLDRV